MQSETKPQMEVLYATHAIAIARYLGRLTGSAETAEDLMQETFLKAMRHWDTLAAAECVRGWLFRIATNTAYDHLRQRRRQLNIPLTVYHEKTLAAEPAGLPLEERELLWMALGRLPERYRTPLLLQAYAGYPIHDIAALLGWKVGTVKSRIHRARVQAQKHYLAV